MDCLVNFCGNEEEELGNKVIPPNGMVVVLVDDIGSVPESDSPSVVEEDVTGVVIEGDTEKCEFYIGEEDPVLKPEFDSQRLTGNSFPQRSSKLSEFMKALPADSVRNLNK